MAMDESIVKIQNARLSFQSIDKHETYEGKDLGRYAATFLIPKESKLCLKLEEAIDDAIGAKYGKKPPRKITNTLRDGDEEVYDGYAGMMALKATSQKRVRLLDRDRSDVSVDDFDDLFYNGCYVNLTVTFSAGKDSYGNHRVWCNLRALQYYKAGERFGGGSPVDVDSEFEEFDDEEIPDDLGI